MPKGPREWDEHERVFTPFHAQLIPLTVGEARFLAHTLFRLEHLHSRSNIKNYSSSHISSSADGFGMLDWWIVAAPYDFAGANTIANGLRERCRGALAAAAPEIRPRLTAKARTAARTTPDLTEWLAALP